MASDDHTVELGTQETPAPGAARRPAPGAARRPLLGQRFGPYQLVSLIGAGGAANVYRARHVHPSQSERSFAVKLPHHRLDATQEEAAQLRREAYVLSLLHHPNVVETFEASVERGRAFIAMEYVDGRNLGEMMRRCAERGIRIPLPVALYIIGQLLAGLEAVYGLCDADGAPLGVTHRDLKPQNVFLSFAGAVKLGDFGLASVTGTSVAEPGVRGTPGYIPPEVLAGESGDRRSDLFSLGVVLFELACGRPLFGGDNLFDRMEANHAGVVPAPASVNPEVSGELEAVMLQALAVDPADRYISATQMRRSLAPHVPTSPGMRLAVASLMRAAFDAELVEPGAAHRAGRTRDSGAQAVVVVSRADVEVEDLCDAAAGCGVDLEIAAPADEVGTGVRGRALRAIIADIDDTDTVAAVAAAAADAPPLPILARASALTVAAVDVAYRLGAVDVLVPPVTAARLETALMSAPAGRVATEETGEGPAGPRALLVTRDASVLERLAGPLADMGLRLEIAGDLDAAVDCLGRASYHAFICDVTGTNAWAASPRIRGLPGVGTVPILYLTRTGASPDQSPRTAGRPRSDPPAAIGAAVMQLVGDTREGRSFKRYPAAFPVKLQCAGSWLAGTSIDLSRGGLLMAADRMVQLGARVELWLSASPGEEPIFGWARVVRVEMPQDGVAEALLGVELESMLPEDEARFVGLIVALDEAARAGGAPVGESAERP